MSVTQVLAMMVNTFHLNPNNIVKKHSHYTKRLSLQKLLCPSRLSYFKSFMNLMQSQMNRPRVEQFLRLLSSMIDQIRLNPVKDVIAKELDKKSSRQTKPEEQPATYRGEKYTTRKVKECRAKVLGNGCREKCRIRCRHKISSALRKDNFISFRKLGDINKQKTFINDMLEELLAERRHQMQEENTQLGHENWRRGDVPHEHTLTRSPAPSVTPVANHPADWTRAHSLVHLHSMTSAPFWYSGGFHFRYQPPESQIYVFVLVGFIFFILTTRNILSEIVTLYKKGLVGYLSRVTTYMELSKVFLTCVMCYVYLRQRTLLSDLSAMLQYGYLIAKQPPFLDFIEMAALDYCYKAAGGFLAFTCIFQMFDMLSAIRRLVIFIQLLKTTITLFFMPLVTGFAYAILAYLMFGKTIETFSNLKFCYLMVNQYFIKPQAIYHSLTESHPYLGPMFVFILGICVNFFVLNFFIAFLNEAYITIIKRISILKYKEREKTKWEYVYEFLGIESTASDHFEEHLWQQEVAEQRYFLSSMKKLLGH
ncbi:hypothetical protein RRG08_016570 [Elysia crispata]|uniref:Polycystin cation channel PKD1/PKD2 domain-containing protein n=1 Tax=Elysia crispata TaxID=231223 RepID=A0AAE1AUJ2_9GAST|nr:hypothetical protein RRG08_016570 [Elysia crispata]